MREKIHGLVLSNLKHSDRHNVVTLYTKERGRMAFVVPSGTTKAARVRNAALMPLSLIEADIRTDATRELQTLASFSPSGVRKSLYSNPQKMALSIFLSEFLTRLLRESAADEATWQFLVTSLEQLDELRGNVLDFHIRMLWGLLGPIGLSPDLDGFETDSIFDLRAGQYTGFTPLHRDVLRGESARMPLLLEAMVTDANRGTAPFARSEVFRFIMRYYTIHCPGMENMRSPEILRQLFSETI